MTDLDELEKLARAATPGPWRGYGEGEYPRGGGLFVCHGWMPMSNAYVCAGHDREAEKKGLQRETGDMKFIAAANPQVVLRLIEELKQLRAPGPQNAPLWTERIRKKAFAEVAGYLDREASVSEWLRAQALSAAAREIEAME